MSIYIKDKENRLYEYRKELAKYNGYDIIINATFKGLEKRGNSKQLLLKNVTFDNNSPICDHVWGDFKKSNKKHEFLKKYKFGDKVKLLVKVKYYVNNKGQFNYGIKIKNVIE